jgi:hypothetical protein
MLEMNEFNNWVIKNTFAEIAKKITSTNKIKKKDYHTIEAIPNFDKIKS